MPRITVPPQPLLVLNPRLDLGFHAFARQSQVVGSDCSALQRLIQRRYPLAKVLARAAEAGQWPVWYVYRAMEPGPPTDRSGGCPPRSQGRALSHPASH